jgi:TRAP-type C4-dicarboxylate transport system permease small subunit
MNARLLPAGPPAPPAIRWLGAVVDYTLVTMGAVMTVLVFCNVLMHLFHQDIAWTTELCEFMMVWVTFLGGASAARRGAHMTITEFIDKLAGKSRFKADAVVQMLCLAVLCLLVWYGIGIVMANWGNILTVLDWPMAFQYLALPVGSTASLVFVGYDLIQILRGKPRKERYGD